MKETYPEEIGRYKILKRIGMGGMGEVFLAYDPVCERNVALKCIRKDLQEKKAICSRFLREAKIASQLTHPSIIPIYAIHSEDASLYYTMSYVDGETLRQILRKTKEQEKKGAAVHPIGGSVSALCQIFLRICEGMSYTHAKTILHRDLKPENIIIGKYGEVMILDWGIADYTRLQKKGTKTGKIAGTVAYMAPERALGEKATYQTDIYSLGVILYQILTLEVPFQRGNLEAFRKYMREEKYINPIELAPHREIPHELLDIVKKCLSFHPENRYVSVEDLIEDVKDTIHGKTSWTFIASLHPEEKKDWEFQEHVMLAKHTAITRHTGIAEWATMMLSKHNFSGNIRLDIAVQLLEESSGVGVLFGVPESPRRQSLRDGYCLWIAQHPARIQLFRSNVLVLDKENIISKNSPHHLIIEKGHEHIRCFFDDTLVFSYTLTLPLTGAHVGLLYRDTQFEMSRFSIYSGSQSVMVNCLAIPDAFFAYQDYDIALAEYRVIGRAFPGRREGQDALFRAGFTQLEKAKLDRSSAEDPYLKALDEFECLHGTPGAPLEYLGKALTYKELSDYDEEAKCLEFALKKFAKHPLLPALEEHIIYRMHESATCSRKAAYKMILLVVRYFPHMLQSREAKLLLQSLESNWQPLFFIEAKEEKKIPLLAVALAFWTDTKQAILEMIHTLIKKLPDDPFMLENALFALSELGYYNDLRKLLDDLKKSGKAKKLERELSLIKCMILKEDPAIKTIFSLTKDSLDAKQIRVLVHLVKKLLLRKDYKKIEKIYEETSKKKVALKEHLDAGFLWSFLLEKNLTKVKTLIRAYPLEKMQDDRSPFFSPYGAFLLLTQGEKAMKEHFSSSLEKPYPPTTALLRHFLQGNLQLESDWMKHAFYWEKQELFLELVLFYRAKNNTQEGKYYEKKLEGRYTRDYRKDLCI